MDNNEICRARISARLSILYWIIVVVLGVFTILWQVPVNDQKNLFGMYKTNMFSKGFMQGNSVPGCITLILTVLIILWGIRCIIVSKKCSLELTNNGISGSRAKLVSSANLQLPIDKIDSIMRSTSLYNKLTGGNTVAIRSASGLIKFPWVQNAEEFVNATLAKIEEYKKTVKKDNQDLIKAVANTAAVPANASSASKIKELKELLDQGLISQEEFDAKRKELLEKM